MSLVPLLVLVLGTAAHHQCNYHYLMHSETGLVLDANENLVYGTIAAMASSQLWYVQPATKLKGERIINVGNKLALAAQYRTNMVTYKVNYPGYNQRWYFIPVNTGSFLIISAENQKLAVNLDGNRASIRERSNGTGQVFIFVNPCKLAVQV